MINPIASAKARLSTLAQKLTSATLTKRTKTGGKIRTFLDSTFPSFVPSSWNYWSYPELTYSAANLLPLQMLDLAQAVGLPPPLPIISAEDYGDGAATEPLGALLDHYGSDKHGHEYTKVYAKILAQLANRKSLSILEIGLGTNNPDFISSMTSQGKPGASVRAFRDYMPNALVYGADLDSTILFNEDRIITAPVDQTKPASFLAMCTDLNKTEFDLIIDDGLHSTEANINTFIFAVGALKPGGWIVIEDIPERSSHVWRGISQMLGIHAGQLIKAKFAYLYAWKKPRSVLES